MRSYDHKKIEKKWQNAWSKGKAFVAKDKSKKPKFYGLIEFPYPSGDGLHVGHIRSNTAMDVISRKRRAEGFEVLYPIGYDAFGLPTENYAIKTGIQPSIVTKKNTDNFRKQLKSLGFSFDWSREINTTDPAYYKWTQWIFLQLYKNGLAYKKKMAINWCPKDKIGLANEEVVDGKCERCGSEVEQREKEQWMLSITKYASRLEKDLDKVDYLEKIKLQQRNWIGKSEGSLIEFPIANSKFKVKVFTTRADTLFGVTYIVLSPEHELFKSDIHISNRAEVDNYINESKKRSTIERTSDSKDKTGVELKDVYAINPANSQKVSVWVADYVLADYGTGAVMAVPAHDERDFEFAKKYNLPIKHVIFPLLSGDLEGGKFKENLPIDFRKHVTCVLYNPESKKYACLKWKSDLGWNTFVGGGVEENEDYLEAGLREIKEETGYINVKFVKEIGQCFGSGYAKHKGVNRLAFINALLFELVDEEKLNVSEEETSKHEIVWVDKKDVGAFININSQLYVWDLLDKTPTAFTSEGLLYFSGEFSKLSSDIARVKISEFVDAEIVTKFKLRDWIFSRQRYWGEPIPMVFCANCGWVPVPENKLPVLLPKVKEFQPTDTGESPLSKITKWVNTKCPKCGENAKRETDTMPNWAGSSWYYLRYTDPRNNKRLADPKKLIRWTPVDWYNGGMEHTTLHLLYSRFWHKFLFDIGVVNNEEPYKKRTSHGLILAEGGVKMSKSKGNVINPDSLVDRFGADALRLYEMFMGPFDQAISWQTDGIVGTYRFLERVRKLQDKVSKKQTLSELSAKLNELIKKISADIEAMRFNTCVSALMIFVNEAEKSGSISKKDFSNFLQLLAPFAPHIAEELWKVLGNKSFIHEHKWPTYDRLIKLNELKKIAVQINGRVRGVIEVISSDNETIIKDKALNLDEVKKWLTGKTIKKIIVIKDRVVSVVTD
jgi:leucyl-tRNA synthetase